VMRSNRSLAIRHWAESLSSHPAQIEFFSPESLTRKKIHPIAFSLRMLIKTQTDVLTQKQLQTGCSTKQNSLYAPFGDFSNYETHLFV
jgi:hypothetical protein